MFSIIDGCGAARLRRQDDVRSWVWGDDGGRARCRPILTDVNLATSDSRARAPRDLHVLVGVLFAVLMDATNWPPSSTRRADGPSDTLAERARKKTDTGTRTGRVVGKACINVYTWHLRRRRPTSYITSYRQI